MFVTLQISDSIPRRQRIQLCVALSNSYIDLNRNAEKAKKILKSLRMELMDEENVDLEDLKPRERAMIYLGLGKAYRYDENDCVTFNSADWGGNCLET